MGTISTSSKQKPDHLRGIAWVECLQANIEGSAWDMLDFGIWQDTQCCQTHRRICIYIVVWWSICSASTMRRKQNWVKQRCQTESVQHGHTYIYIYIYIHNTIMRIYTHKIWLACKLFSQGIEMMSTSSKPKPYHLRGIAWVECLRRQTLKGQLEIC